MIFKFTILLQQCYSLTVHSIQVIITNMTVLCQLHLFDIIKPALALSKSVGQHDQLVKHVDTDITWVITE